MMKRLIVVTFMVLGILQVLCISSYSCEPTSIDWETTYIDGKPAYSNKAVVVRPGQFILFRVYLNASDNLFRKVKFRFTNVESQDEAFYEETDRINQIHNIAQVGIHWKEDGKIVKPGRYLVEVQAPYRNMPVRKCSESSNILSREVVFDPGNTTEESEAEDKE